MTTSLSLPPAPPVDNFRAGFVDARPTARRLRALAHLGHGHESIATALDWPCELVADLRSGLWASRIAPARAAAIAELYESWRSLPGRNPAAHRLAIREQWAPPSAWGRGFPIDDPATDPALVWSTRELSPRLRRLVRAEAIAARKRGADSAAARRRALARARESIDPEFVSELPARPEPSPRKPERLPPDRWTVLAVIRGERPLTALPPEHRWLPVHALRASGMPLDEIPQHVHVDRRTVLRVAGPPPADAIA